MSTPSAILIYGSYGYTGQLIVKKLLLLLSQAKVPPFSLILSGRSEKSLQDQLRNCHVSDDNASQAISIRPFTLSPTTTTEEICNELFDVDGNSKVKVLLNCAGPFIETAEKMAYACLQSKVHYLDSNNVTYSSFSLI